MTETTMDKARLAAFVDGELSPEDAAEVVMHLAADPVDQAYVDELMALNVMIGVAFDAPLHEPVPPAILATIAENGIVPAEKRRVVPMTHRPLSLQFTAWGGGMALAAGIAGFLVISDFGAPDHLTITVGPVPTASAQLLALAELETGASRMIADGVELSVTASFQTADKGVCREFRIARGDDAPLDLGVACPSAGSDAEWRIEAVDTVAMAEAAPSFTPASGQGADPIGDFLDMVGAGRALTPAEEAKARAQNWLSAE